MGLTQQNGEMVYYLGGDGAGFDMTYANRWLGVFQRLHNADNFAGVGLATVQRAIHQGGCVGAEATVEQEATVYWALPLRFTLEGEQP